jgi:uncharacterized protein YwgA
MAHIAGFSSEKDAKGNLKKVTFDFKKYGPDLMPLLKKIGAIEEDTFEKEWKEAERTGFTLEEAKKELYRRIDERWDKKLSSQKK